MGNKMFGKKSGVTKFKFTVGDNFISFKPFFDMEGSPISCGFVKYNKERSTEVIPEVSYVNGKKIMAVKLRVDTRTVPAKLLNKEYEKALKDLIERKTTTNEYGEVEEYIPFKETKRELKEAIKKRLLRNTAPVPNYYDVILCSELGRGYISTTSKKALECLEQSLDRYRELKKVIKNHLLRNTAPVPGHYDAILCEDLGQGYISTTSKKDVKCLEQSIDGIEDILDFYITDEEVHEDDFSYFIESVYKQDKNYSLHIPNSAKLKDSSDSGNVSFVDALEKEQVDKLLEMGYEFVEAELEMTDVDVTFKMKNWENVFAFEDEAMEVEEEEKQEEISQRWLALEGLYEVLNKNIKTFLEN
jgi:hypothetical protein